MIPVFHVRILLKPLCDQYLFVVSGGVIKEHASLMAESFVEQWQCRVTRVFLNKSRRPIDHQHIDVQFGEIIQFVPVVFLRCQRDFFSGA